MRLRLVYFSFCLVMFWLFSALTGANPLIDRAYVIVNDNVIAESEVERELRNLVSDLRTRRESIPPLPELRKQVVEGIVMQWVQYQYAKQLGMSIDDEIVEEAILGVAQRNNLSMLLLRDEVLKTGRSFEEYQEEIRRQLLVERLVEKEITQTIRVSEEEIDHYLEAHPLTDTEEEFNLSHIVIELGGNPENAAVVAKEVSTRLNSGELFENIAIEFSRNAPASLDRELGWRQASQLPNIFLEKIRNLEVGEVSRPIQSQNGFHFLRLNAKRGGGSYVVDQIRARQILLTPTEVHDDDETLDRLHRIRERIVTGEEFTEMVRLHSTDLRSRPIGGDLGWLNPTDLAPELERVTALLNPGELSLPVHTRFGYHLIEVTGRRNQDIGSHIRRTEARRQIQSQKFNQRYDSWARELRDRAWIDYRVEFGD